MILGYKFNGQVTDALFTRPGEFLPEEIASHKEDLSRAIGCRPSDLEEFYADEEPKVEYMIPPAPAPERVLSPVEKLAAALIKDAGASAEVKAAAAEVLASA